MSYCWTRAPARRRAIRPGVYALAEWRLYSEGAQPAQGLDVFARYGHADGGMYQTEHYVGAGAVYTGPIPGRGDDRLGLAIANAIDGDPFRTQQRREGVRTDSAEIAIELSYRAVLFDWLALQPDVQYIVNPGTRASTPNALVFGLRVELGRSITVGDG